MRQHVPAGALAMHDELKDLGVVARVVTFLETNSPGVSMSGLICWAEVTPEGRWRRNEGVVIKAVYSYTPKACAKGGRSGQIPQSRSITFPVKVGSPLAPGAGEPMPDGLVRSVLEIAKRFVTGH